MLWLDDQFIGRLSGQLDRFKAVQSVPSVLYNFRCPSSPPFCGDSSKQQFKARAYLYATGDHYVFHCHNCGLHLSFDRFLEEYDPHLHAEYTIARLEQRKGRRHLPATSRKTIAPVHDLPSDIFRPVTGLSPSHPVARYVRSRKLPQSCWPLLYAVEETRLLGVFVPRYKERLHMTDPRLVLPARGRGGALVALVCRAVLPEAKLRYVTLRVDEEEPIIFGLDRVRWDRPIVVVEGPIDSLFLTNAVAVGGSDLKRAASVLPNSVTTYVFDNEPRNAEIVAKMRRCISTGLRLCIWPDTPGKDVNELILRGWTREQVEEIIRENTVEGLEAEMRMTRWARVGH